MELKILPDELSVCKLAALPSEDVPEGFFSLTRTDQEISPGLRDSKSSSQYD